MTDPDATGGHPLAEPESRGRLDIADRVVERIAMYAAAAVPNVVQVGSTLERVVGRQYPKASADVAGRRTRIGVDVAVAWPAALTEVLLAVRDTVRSQVHDLAGLEVDAVDVTAAKIVHVQPAMPRRVV